MLEQTHKELNEHFFGRTLASNLKEGKVFFNQTLKYMLPQLLIQDVSLKSIISKERTSKNAIIAFGVGDHLLESKISMEDKCPLYICVPEGSSIAVELRTHSLYFTDYSTDGLTIICLDLSGNKRLSEIYKAFLAGKYSEMVNEAELALINAKYDRKKISEESRVDPTSYWSSINVYSRAEEYIPVFVSVLLKVFYNEEKDTETRSSILTDAIIEGKQELDFPVVEKQEIFNYLYGGDT